MTVLKHWQTLPLRLMLLFVKEERQLYPQFRLELHGNHRPPKRQPLDLSLLMMSMKKNKTDQY